MQEEHWRPGSKAELIEGIEREWDLLMALAARLSPEEMVTPDAGGWSPKDNLAHLAEWLKILMGFYMDLRRAHDVMGVPPEVTQVWDFEARQNLLFERNRDRPLDDVLEELRRSYAELMARLEKMTFDDLLKPQHPFDPARRPLLDAVLRGSVEHFAEHRQRIEAAR
jgi:hypothetical protein